MPGRCDGLHLVTSSRPWTALLFIGGIAIALCVSAVGGWFGSITRKEDEGALGAWLTVANIGAAGLVGAGAIHLLRGLPPALGDGAAGLTVLAAPPSLPLGPPARPPTTACGASRASAPSPGMSGRCLGPHGGRRWIARSCSWRRRPRSP